MLKNVFPFVLGYGNVYYVDLARAKSEALVNNMCKQKTLNHVMLNGDDSEMASRLIDLIIRFCFFANY